MRGPDTPETERSRAPAIPGHATPPVSRPELSADPVLAVRRQARHDVYSRLALLSAVIWTLGTLLLFVLFAAGNPRPIPMAMMSMTVPLVFAVLPWLLYRPLTARLTERRLRAQRESA